MKVDVFIMSKVIWLLISSVVLFACSGLTARQEKTIVELQKNVEFTLNQVGKKIKDNPESALQNSLLALDNILEYTATVKSDPSKFSPEKIQAYILKIKIINENMQRFSDLTLQTDVSFPLGTYKLKHLAKKGKYKSNKLVAKIVSSTREMAIRYPQKPIKIMLKAVGYTDETKIVSGSRLEREIIQAISQQAIQTNPSKKRRQYNQMLSQFRASTLTQYIVQRLSQQLPTNYPVEITTEIIGFGEKLPKKKPIGAPYRNKDPRRRICIISPFIEIIP